MSLPAIDWSRPWLAPLRVRGEPAARRVEQGASVAQALNEALGVQPSVQLPAGPLRFVPQASVDASEAYEAFIARTACVPTRDNAHDFFNGLMWLHRPGLKASLNAAQSAEIARDGIGTSRGDRRDALTLFDENGALLFAPQPLLQALREHDWRLLFIMQRSLWREARLQLFGHALLEKLLQPRAAITAHVVIADARGEPLRPIAKPFVPLPVLGVPGWWPGNEAPGFYDDASVFRPRRGAAQADSAGRKPSIER
jgi:hypothetical protein